MSVPMMRVAIVRTSIDFGPIPYLARFFTLVLECMVRSCFFFVPSLRAPLHVRQYATLSVTYAEREARLPGCFLHSINSESNFIPRRSLAVSSLLTSLVHYHCNLNSDCSYDCNKNPALKTFSELCFSVCLERFNIRGARGLLAHQCCIFLHTECSTCCEL